MRTGFNQSSFSEYEELCCSDYSKEGGIDSLEPAWRETCEDLTERLGTGKLTESELSLRTVHSDVVASEVGDDFTAVARALSWCLRFLFFVEQVVHMRISWDDTSVNQGLGNLAEGIIDVPGNQRETWHSTRNSGLEGEIGYIDVPKTRLVVHTSSQHAKYSDTPLGKTRDASRLVKWIEPSSPLLTFHQLALVFQDACLGSVTISDPVYVPECFGGGGKPPAFGLPLNFQRFFTSYKGGSYAPTIALLVQDANQWFKSRGQRPPSDVLKYFASIDHQFRNWLKGTTDVVCLGDSNRLPPELRQYELFRPEPGTVQDEVASRLLSLGLAVTSTQLLVAFEHNERTSSLLTAENVVAFNDYKDACLQTGMRPLTEARELAMSSLAGLSPDIWKADVAFFLRRCDSDSSNLRRFILRDAVYDHDAMDYLYEQYGCMKVDKAFAMEPRVATHSGYLYNVERDVENTKHIGADIDLLVWAKGGGEGPCPRVIINDDNELISQALEVPRGINLAVSTDDKKLCQLMAEKTGKTVLRVPSKWALSLQMIGSNGPETAGLPGKWEVLEDTGSLESAEEQNTFGGAMLKRPLVLRALRMDESVLEVRKSHVPVNQIDVFEYAFEHRPVTWPDKFFSYPSGRRPKKFSWSRRVPEGFGATI